MNKMHYKLLGGICLAAASVAARAQTAPAPVATAEPAQGDTGDIVVTAQRRSERLQNVPVSITALSGAQLAERRVETANDLVGSIPNLQASSTIGEGTPIFSLRGISLADYSVNQQGPVATYFDEVYKGSFPLMPLGLFDLDRVEVLRGPQGTLYGKNTTGGAINFISRKPVIGETGGYLSAGYGNYDRYEANGAVNVALGEKLAARAAFTFARADGWFRNRFPGQPDANATRQYGIRLSLLAAPTDRLSFILRGSTSLQNPDNYGIYARPTAAGVGAGDYEAFGAGSSYFRTGLGRRELESENLRRLRHRTDSVSLTSDWKVTDTLDITSVTSYDYGKLFIPEDADGSPLRAIEDSFGGSSRQFSEDLRVATSFTSGPNFIVGAYYNREIIHAANVFYYFLDIDVDGNGTLDFNDCTVNFFIGCTYRNSFKQVKKSAAIYSDANWPVTDRIILRGGLRYTRDRGSLSDYRGQVLGSDGTPIANTVPGDPNDFDATTGRRFNKGAVTGKVGIDYKVAGDKLLYISYSRGYRGSSFNSQAYFSPSELGVAKPESIDAYEAGFKTQFFERRVTFNGAVFYYNYTNQQALSIDPVTNTQNLINIPKSRLLGAEFELSARPVTGVRLNAGLGLLDTKIRQGTVSGADIRGNQLPNAPNVSLSGGVDVDLIANATGKLTLGLSGSYFSKQYFELLNEDDISQRRYATVDAHLAARTASDRYGLSVWVKNMFNKYYVTSAIDLKGFGYDYFHLGEPRMYGVTLDGKF